LRHGSGFVSVRLLRFYSRRLRGGQFFKVPFIARSVSVRTSSRLRAIPQTQCALGSRS
jgi:hypothetical protein